MPTMSAQKVLFEWIPIAGWLASFEKPGESAADRGSVEAALWWHAEGFRMPKADSRYLSHLESQLQLLVQRLCEVGGP